MLPSVLAFTLKEATCPVDVYSQAEVSLPSLIVRYLRFVCKESVFHDYSLAHPYRYTGVSPGFFCNAINTVYIPLQHSTVEKVGRLHDHQYGDRTLIPLISSLHDFDY